MRTLQCSSVQLLMGCSVCGPMPARPTGTWEFTIETTCPDCWLSSPGADLRCPPLGWRGVCPRGTVGGGVCRMDTHASDFAGLVTSHLCFQRQEEGQAKPLQQRGGGTLEAQNLRWAQQRPGGALEGCPLPRRALPAPQGAGAREAEARWFWLAPFHLCSVFPPQAVSPLSQHCGERHLGPQPAVARGEDRCSRPHGSCVLPLGAPQQRRPVGEAGGAPRGNCRRRGAHARSCQTPRSAAHGGAGAWGPRASVPHRQQFVFDHRGLSWAYMLSVAFAEHRV